MEKGIWISEDGKKYYFREEYFQKMGGYSTFFEKFGVLRFDSQNNNFGRCSYYRHKDKSNNKRYDTSSISDKEIDQLIKKSLEDNTDYLYERLKEYVIDVKPIEYEDGIIVD